MTEQKLTVEQTKALKALASARNYQYECNMSDYSQGSIDRSKRLREEAEAACVRLGIQNPLERIEWSDKGHFVALV